MIMHDVVLQNTELAGLADVDCRRVQAGGLALSCRCGRRSKRWSTNYRDYE